MSYIYPAKDRPSLLQKRPQVPVTISWMNVASNRAVDGSRASVEVTAEQ